MGQAARLATDTWGKNARTVSTPGFFVSPALIFQSVVNGTPESWPSARSCALLKSAMADRTASALGNGVFMQRNLPHCVSVCQPDSVIASEYGLSMDEDDPNHPRRILWRNLCALMGTQEPTIPALVKKTQVGQGTIQRIRDMDVSVGIDIVQRMAEQFGLDAWQLLAPLSFDQDLPPDAMLIARKFNELPMGTFEQISARRWMFATILRMLSIAEQPQSNAPALPPAPQPSGKPARLK